MQSAADLAERIRSIGEAAVEALPDAVEAGTYEIKDAIQRQIVIVVGADRRASNAGPVNVTYRMQGRGERTSALIAPIGPVHWFVRGTAAHSIPGRVSFGEDEVAIDIGHPGAYSRSAPPDPWGKGIRAGAPAAVDKFGEVMTKALEEV